MNNYDGCIKSINELEKNKDIVKQILSGNGNEFIQRDIEYLYTYHSNKIENNQLSFGETITVLKDGFGVTKPIKDIDDIINHHKALKFVINELVANKETLNLKTIREIQSLIEPTKSGFRKIPVEILNTSVKTTEPFEIQIKLDEILNEYNNSIDDFFTRLAKFHIEFERTHTFLDGNGRTGRLLLNMELMKNGYPLTIIKIEDKSTYYEAFKNPELMQELIVKSVDDTLKLIIEKCFLDI